MERAQLLAARHRLHLSLQEAARRLGVGKATVHRWEKKGDVPQPYHLGKLCDLYGLTARELGFSEPLAEEQTAIGDELESNNVLASFRATYLPLRLLRLVCSWHSARYHELQRMISLELGDNMMDDSLNRRDALRFLALLPLEMSGLSSREAVFRSSHEEILAQCTAGVTACWHLLKGKDPTFAANAIAAYLPTLKAIASSAPASQCKIVAELLAQCFVLKARISMHIEGSSAAIGYARVAEKYAEQADHLTLRISALRTRVSACSYAHQLGAAREAAEKAKYLIETATVPLPHLVSSDIYAGLAELQAQNRQKEEALRTLEKAHITFFSASSDDDVPIWITSNRGGLVFNDGMTHYHLGMYAKSLNSFGQPVAERSALGRIETLITEVKVEVSRDDQPRDMDWCIDHWTQGIIGAKTLQSQQRINEAMQVYTVMQAVWPGEKRIHNLRDHLLD